MPVTGGGQDAFDAAMQVLVAEPPAKGLDTKDPAESPGEFKGEAKTRSPPPAATEGAAVTQ